MDFNETMGKIQDSLIMLNVESPKNTLSKKVFEALSKGRISLNFI